MTRSKATVMGTLALLMSSFGHGGLHAEEPVVVSAVVAVSEREADSENEGTKVTESSALGEVRDPFNPFVCGFFERIPQAFEDTSLTCVDGNLIFALDLLLY